MRGALRSITTLLAIIFGAGTLSPLVGANWQEWAKQTGNDQYFVKYAGPAMDKLVPLVQTGWFIFAAGFFIGGAICLWIDYLLRKRPIPVPSSKAPKLNLAHALHMPSSTGMHVIVDQRKKVIQIGFRLKNSADIPLRYTVQSISTVIEGKTVMNATAVNKGGVVVRQDTTTYFFAPIPFTIGKKDVQAEASILYQYGPAGADEQPAREANYRVNITISPTSHAYLILEENDGGI
jgi:hypothetical protein